MRWAVAPVVGAFFVSEQIALDQVVGNRRAVDRDERPVGAVAVLEDAPRDQFLAGALSPVIITVTSLAVTWPIILNTSCMAAELPTIPSL